MMSSNGAISYVQAFTLTDITALAGLIFGLTGFILGILNYLRDRSKVTIDVRWDMTIINDPRYNPNEKWCLVTAANIGRRPIYLSHAAFPIPRKHGGGDMLLGDSVAGQKLAEGDPPLKWIMEQKGLDKYAKEWRNFRAEIIDSTSRKWRSKKPKRNIKPPSWAI